MGCGPNWKLLQFSGVIISMWSCTNHESEGLCLSIILPPPHSLDPEAIAPAAYYLQTQDRKKKKKKIHSTRGTEPVSYLGSFLCWSLLAQLGRDHLSLGLNTTSYSFQFSHIHDISVHARRLINPPYMHARSTGTRVAPPARRANEYCVVWRRC